MRYSIMLLLIFPPASIALLEETKETRSTASSKVLVRIAYSNSLESAPGFTRPIFVLWPDGKMLWSQDQLTGNPPYFIGKIDIKSYEEFTEKLFNSYNLKIDKWNLGKTRVHMPYISMQIRHNEINIGLDSDHEMIEASGRYVATAEGESIDLKSSKYKFTNRLEVLAKQPKKYILFRYIWNDLKHNLLSLRLGSGKEVKITIVGDEINWLE